MFRPTIKPPVLPVYLSGYFGAGFGSSVPARSIWILLLEPLRRYASWEFDYQAWFHGPPPIREIIGLTVPFRRLRSWCPVREVRGFSPPLFRLAQIRV